MANFKLKIVINNVEIELEGNFEEVKELYNVIKGDVIKFELDIPREKTKDSNEKNTFDNKMRESFKKTEKKRSNKKGLSKRKTNKLEFVDLVQSFNEADFVNEFRKYKLKTSKDKILYSVFLYKKLFKVEVVDINIIHTLLDKVGVVTPKNIRSMISNFVNRDKLLEKVDKNKYKMKHIGINYCEGIKLNEDK